MAPCRGAALYRAIPLAGLSAEKRIRARRRRAPPLNVKLTVEHAAPRVHAERRPALAVDEKHAARWDAGRRRSRDDRESTAGCAGSHAVVDDEPALARNGGAGACPSADPPISGAGTAGAASPMPGQRNSLIG